MVISEPPLACRRQPVFGLIVAVEDIYGNLETALPAMSRMALAGGPNKSTLRGTLHVPSLKTASLSFPGYLESDRLRLLDQDDRQQRAGYREDSVFKVDLRSPEGQRNRHVCSAAAREFKIHRRICGQKRAIERIAGLGMAHPTARH